MNANVIVIETGAFENLLNRILRNVLADNNMLIERNDKNSDLLRRVEAASYLQMSLPTLSRYTKEGIIPSYKLKNKILYKKSDLDSALSKRNFK